MNEFGNIFQGYCCQDGRVVCTSKQCDKIECKDHRGFTHKIGLSPFKNSFGILYGFSSNFVLYLLSEADMTCVTTTVTF